MANAFSNPALFQHFKPVQTENWETAVQLASFKRAEFDKGQEEMNQWMNALASTPIDNLQAKAHFEDRVKTTLTEIDRVTTANDISNRGMREKILSSVGSVLDDTTINAMSASRQRRSYEAQWQALKQQKPELYSDLNYGYGIAGYNEYINADKDAQVGQFVKNSFSVIPYTNIKGITDEVTMELIKQKGKKEYTEDIYQTFTDENGKEYQKVVGQRQLVEVGFNDAELEQILSSTLNDPTVKQQMMINAWGEYGGFSEDGVKKLVVDYGNFVDGLKKDHESKKQFHESLLNSGKYTEQQKEEIKKTIAYHDSKLLELPKYLEDTTKEIEAGRYTNASTQIYQNSLISEGKSKFSTLYSKYQNGVKADEMFWKEQEYNLSLSKFDYEKYKDKVNWSYEDKKLDIEREKINSNSGLNPDGTYMMTEEEMNMEDIEPLDFMNNKLKEVGDGVRSSISDIVTLLDDQLRDDNTDTRLKSEAKAVKNNYINYLVDNASKKGVKINKEYMQTLSIKELTEKYEKGDFKGYALYGVVKRSEDSIPNLKLAGGYDILSEAKIREDDYKVEHATKTELEKTYNDSLQKHIFTKDFMSTLMKEDAKVFTGSGVALARNAYSKYLNTDGTWKKGVSETQKNSIFKQLQNTYEAQKNFGEDYTSKEGLKKVVEVLGGSESDIVYVPSGQGYKGGYVLKNGTRTKELFENNKELFIRDTSILPKHVSQIKNTSLAKDKVFSKHFENGSSRAESELKLSMQKHINDGLFTEKVAIIPFKNGDGKANTDATRLALLVNNRTGGAKVDMDEATAIRLVQNNNDTYTVRFNTTVDGEKGKISIQESVVFSKSELINAMPDFAKKMNLNKTNSAPTYTFSKQGYKPIVIGNISYIEPSNKRALEIKSGGDPTVANHLHTYGAMHYISSVGTNANAFKKFDGLAQKLHERLTTIDNDFQITVKYSSDKTKADVSLVEKGSGEAVHTVQRELTNNSLDEIKKRADKTPQIYINEIIADVIHENYNNSLQLYNRPEFVRLFGKLNIKED